MAHICHTQLKYKEAQDFMAIYSYIKSVDVNYFNISHRDKAVHQSLLEQHTSLCLMYNLFSMYGRTLIQAHTQRQYTTVS